jgi:hypothetical protein
METTLSPLLLFQEKLNALLILVALTNIAEEKQYLQSLLEPPLTQLLGPPLISALIQLSVVPLELILTDWSWITFIAHQVIILIALQMPTALLLIPTTAALNRQVIQLILGSITSIAH